MHGTMLVCLLVQAVLGIPIRLALARVSHECKDVINGESFVAWRDALAVHGGCATLREDGLCSRPHGI